METAPTEERFIKTVEWEMLDKSRFYPLSMASSFTVRCFLYPLTLIRTRLQIQYRNNEYSGTFDAGKKILKTEGVRGLYKGFFVSAFQVVSGVFYVSTYEGVRHFLDTNRVTQNDKVKAFVGGACASVVGQTCIVPFDVISQHMMLRESDTRVQRANTRTLENLKKTEPAPCGGSSHFRVATAYKTRTKIVAEITKTIYRQDGIKGFYRGYFASLGTYVPSSAAWWSFYHFFQDFFYAVLPGRSSDPIPHTIVQCLAAMSSGCATCVLTNPLDLTRARVQVQRKSIPETLRTLWREEGVGLFKKGLTARMASSSIYSVAVILGYESVKKLAVHEEYKNKVLW